MATRKFQQDLRKSDHPTLSRLEKLKTVERFNDYKRAGTDNLSEMEIQRILDQIGQSPSIDEIKQMTSLEVIDQFYFAKVVEEYKIFCQENNTTLLFNAYQSLKNDGQKQIRISKLQETLLNDFDIDIKSYISQSKQIISFQQFKTIFG